MRIEYGTINGSLTLSDDLELYGILAGSCDVPAGRHLRVFGIVAGDLLVAGGGSAEVYGTVSGSVSAEGTVDLAGIIAGQATGPGLKTRRGSYVNGVEQAGGQYGPSADFGDG